MEERKRRDHAKADIRMSLEGAHTAYLAGAFTDVRVHALDALGRLQSDQLSTRIDLHLLLAQSPEGTMANKEKQSAFADANTILSDPKICHALYRPVPEELPASQIRLAESQYIRAHLLRALLAEKGMHGPDAEVQEFRAIRSAQMFLGKGGISQKDAINGHLCLIARAPDSETAHRHIRALEEIPNLPPAILIRAYISIPVIHYREVHMQEIDAFIDTVKSPLLRAELLLKKLRILIGRLPVDLKRTVETRSTLRNIKKTIDSLQTITEAKQHHAWAHFFLGYVQNLQNNKEKAVCEFHIAEEMAEEHMMDQLQRELGFVRQNMENDRRREREAAESEYDEDEGEGKQNMPFKPKDTLQENWDTGSGWKDKKKKKKKKEEENDEEEGCA